MKKVFIPIPKFDCYFGEKVTKETKLNFENGKVKQHLENLILVTDYEINSSRVKSKIHTEINLNEGEIILLEEDGRGYFVPQEQNIGELKDLKNEVKFFEGQIKKIKE